MFLPGSGVEGLALSTDKEVGQWVGSVPPANAKAAIKLGDELKGMGGRVSIVPFSEVTVIRGRISERVNKCFEK